MSNDCKEESIVLSKLPLDKVEPSTSFVCTSGVLFWGQLCGILTARDNEAKGDKKYDGMLNDESKSSQLVGERGYFEMTFHHKCLAELGKWLMYQYNFKGEYGDVYSIVLFCHESQTPKDIFNKANTVDFDWELDPNAEVLYVNRYDLSQFFTHKCKFGKKWQRHWNDLFLVDPTWVIEKEPKLRGALKDYESGESEDYESGESEDYESGESEDYESGDSDFDYEIDHKDYEMDKLFGMLKAKHEKDESNERYNLLDAEDNVCGLLALDFGRGINDEWIFGHLVFNADRKLIGFSIHPMDVFDEFIEVFNQ